MRKTIGGILAAFALLFVSPPTNASAVGRCWYCQCVTNCSCLSGGNGASCTASSGGCTVSGTCSPTLNVLFTPGGVVLARADLPKELAEKLLAQHPGAVAPDRAPWEVLSTGVMVIRDCSGTVLRRRYTHSVAANTRRLTDLLIV